MKYDELSTQQKENPSTVNQLLAQIQELQDKVNSLNNAKEFYHPETASSSGVSHASGHFFEGLLARGESSSALFEVSNNLASSSCRWKPIDTGKITEQREG